MSEQDRARLEEIRARLAKITPGPWVAKRIDRKPGRCDGITPAYHNHDGDDCYEVDEPCPATQEIVTTDSGYYGPRWDDADFIAHAPEDIAYLLAVLEQRKG